ncbi:MAG: class I SAM-dependent methyltransferase [Planctomycetota bacterium]
MSGPQKVVSNAIAEDNDWYTGSQLEWSEGPARFIHSLRESFLRFALSRAPGKRIVELGCGDGVNLYRLRDSGAELRGYDYNPLRVERAKKLVPEANVEQLDLSLGECPLAGQADLLIFSHVLEHIDDDMTALSGLRRWLAPGGVIALLVPNEGCLFSRIRMGWIDPWIREQTDHVHFYTRRSLKRLCREAGFQVSASRREVLTFPGYRFHMGFVRRAWGYRLLRTLDYILPSQTSGLMFLLESKP